MFNMSEDNNEININQNNLHLIESELKVVYLYLI